MSISAVRHMWSPAAPFPGQYIFLHVHSHNTCRECSKGGETSLSSLSTLSHLYGNPRDMHGWSRHEELYAVQCLRMVLYEPSIFLGWGRVWSQHLC